MATITSNNLTLVDLAKRTNNGNMLLIAEVLEETNEYVKDAVHVEANGTTQHTFNKRVALPSGGWRAMNEGSDEERSIVEQAEEGMGMLEAWSKVDAKLVEIAPDPKKFRSDEELAFVAGLGLTHAAAFIYGNLGTNPKGINGLAQRYHSIALPNVWDAGGASALSSIWMVQWGDTKAHFLHPKGAKIGLQIDDKGKQTVLDDNKKPYDAYRTKFSWDTGLAVHDDKCVQRIAKIATGSALGTVDDLMIKALNKMPARGKGAMIYMNDTLLSMFEINAKDKTNVNYSTTNLYGEELISFRGRPLRLMDRINNAEADVTA